MAIHGADAAIETDGLLASLAMTGEVITHQSLPPAVIASEDRPNGGLPLNEESEAVVFSTASDIDRVTALS